MANTHAALTMPTVTSIRTGVPALLLSILLLFGACSSSSSNSSADTTADTTPIGDLGQDTTGTADQNQPQDLAVDTTIDTVPGDLGGEEVNDQQQSDGVDTVDQTSPDSNAPTDVVNVGCKPISPTPDDVTHRAILLAQGFKHEWLRRIATFQTPHRISGLSAWFSDEKHLLDNNGLWTADATANFGFSTGVDGDKADPLMHYRGIYSPQIRVFRGSVEFQFSDLASQTDDPEAETSLTRWIGIDTACLDLIDGTSYSVLLSGFSIVSKCDPVKQPNSEECNSDGFWPHKLYFGIDQCQVNADRLACRVSLDLFRSWTPTQGGLKPFNYALDYSVRLHYVAIAGPGDQFSTTNLPQLSRSGTNLEGTRTGLATVLGKTDYPLATVGIRGFGFELKKTDNFEKLGRYMTELTFGVNNQSYTPNDGEFKYNYWFGFNSPVTVAKSDVQYTMNTTLLQFKTGARLTDVKQIKGTICVSGPGFKCANQNLPEQKTDSVPVKLSQPDN